MAGFKLFSNATEVEPITVELVVWVKPEERRRLLWEAVLERRLEDCSIPSEGPQPTGGVCNAQTIDEICDRISAQDDQNTHLRRKTRQKLIETQLTDDETLHAGAREKVVRIGVERFVVDPSRTIAATMIAAQKDDLQDRTRVTSKSSSKRAGSHSRGLLHLGNLLPPPVEPTTGLGPSRTVVFRSSERHNHASRVIA